MTEGTGPEAPQAGSICGALATHAEELQGVASSEAAGGVEYRRGAVVFATCESDGASFRLRPEIVSAALKTPDTSASRRGPEWVTLQPASLDTFTLDRAIAWFETAWRIAGEQPERRAAPN